MRVFEVIQQSTRSIQSSKLRSGLTLLAISVGVFAIISATTAVKVLDTFFKDTMAIMGGDVITLTRFPTVNLGNTDWEYYRNRERITFDQMEDLEDYLDEGKEIGPIETFSMTRVFYETEQTEPNIQLQGANVHFLSNNAYNISEGRNFLQEDIDNARRLAIIGADLLPVLFENINPIGKVIRIDGYKYTIIGVTEAKGQIFGNTMDRFVIIPYTTAIGIYGRNRDIAIQFKAGSVDQVEKMISEVTGWMRVIRKVDPERENDFEITTNESLGSATESFTSVLYIIGFVIGGIVLLGAGIGVMNIMLVTVTERTREIGLRKAVGATKKAIVSQFLTEAIVLCQIGGIIGIAAGIALGNGAAIWLDTSVVIPVGSVLMGILGMTGIGILFGVYPALKASQLDPIESLRYE